MAEVLPPVITGTDPTTWEGWMELINALQTGSIILPEDQQIVVYEAFEVWCQAHKIAPIYTIKQVLTGFGEVVNPSPTTGTDIIVRPITTLVPAAGGAISEIIKNGGNAWALVKKSIVLAAVTALFTTSVGAFQVPDKIRARMEAVIDNFTVDGENVPVLIDRSGNTFLQNDLLEAMRAEMVNMGAFNTGGVQEAPVPQGIADIIGPLVRKEASYEDIRYRNIYAQVTEGHMYSVDTIRKTPGTGGSVYSFAAIKTDDTSKVDHIYVTSYWQNTEHTGLTYIFASDQQFNFAGVFEASIGSDGVYDFYGGSSAGVSQATINGKTVYYRYFSIGASGSQVITSDVVSPNLVSDNYMDQKAWSIVYGDFTGGQAVEGITPAADLIQNGVTDLTKTLREVVPDLGPAIKTATPTDTDLFDQTDWDPISLLGVNPWTDGLTETQHESATDGKPDEKSQEDMLDAIRQMISEYFPDPTYPVPDPDPTPEPAPPVLDGSSNGLWAIYNPTKQQVKDFGAWLWSDSIIDQIERQFKNSPIDAVIGFHQIYCTPITGAAKTIKAGYLDSPVSAPEVTNQYADINCGTVSVPEYYGNAIDYVMTKISLYLPFIGFVPLDAGIVMGSQVNIRYRIDVLTGACIAQVRVMKSGNTVVFYNYQGNCAVQIPLTASTYTGIVGALMGAVTAGVSVMTGNAAGAYAGVRGTVTSLAQGHQIQQSGSLGSNAGALGIRIPYMIIARPIQHMPAGFESLEGIPSNDTVRIGDCTGFLRVKSAHYDSITDATAEEVNMIRELLEGGIMI